MLNEILIIKDKDTNQYVPIKPNGYNEYVLPSDMEMVLDDLINYYDSYSDEQIKNINENIKSGFFNSNKTRKAQDKSGYVYIFKCVDKFKVGYSKNVEQRLRQLDTRPFPVTCVFRAYYENAYDVEHAVHKKLQPYQVCNEWYMNLDLEELISTIKNEGEL